MPKIALVTGSTGFMGSNLCRALLASGYQVRAFHRSGSSLKLLAGLDVEHALGDVTQADTLVTALKGAEVVFHAASKVDYWRGGGGMYAVTVGGTQNVARAALEAGVQRLVYTSSVASLGIPEPIRGKRGAAGLMNENHVWNYRPAWWRYGHAKHLAEMEIQKAVAQGLDAVIVNPSMVLGPGDANRISGEIVIQVSRGIVRFGIGGGVNAIHIQDAVRGHILALERGRTGERYILGGENHSYLDFIQTTADVVGVRPPKSILPSWLLRPLAGPLDILCQLVPMPFNGDLLRFSGRYLYYDTQKAQQVLGLTALHSVRMAIQEAYEWYKAEGMV
ncbi:MAG: NAD-dependent epimerase/dehydratase family protein [Anaerolineales bacterium]|nr:NAD-dependent epimerase/dehydratase family protein [Anaerolineales bacterium]